MSRSIVLPLLSALAAACGGKGGSPVATPSGGPGLHFRDVTAEAGIAYRNRTGAVEKEKLIETMGGGTTFLDFDVDGDPDLFVTNGWSRLGFPAAEAPRKALYRNDGGGRFSDCTEASGLQSQDWSMGCVAADWDGDGDPDLVVTGLGRTRLYRNEGEGRFVDVAPRSGADRSSWGTGAAFGDADGDGDLDLFVVEYIEWDWEFVPTDKASCRYRDIMVPYGPRGFPGAKDLYWRNAGDGRFEESADACGLADAERAYGFQPLFADPDDDGDADLFVANDSVGNQLYRNRGDGRFEEVAMEAGVALSSDGRPQAGMGAAFADLDGDGRLDLVVTNFSDDNSNVFRNEGGGFFTDVAYSCGVASPSFSRLKWAVVPEDFDADGATDLFIANGHTYPHVDLVPLNTSYAQANQLFRNRGDGTFEEIGDRSGLAEKRVWRGASAADVDGDLDPDLFVTAIDAPAALLRNDTAPSGNRLVVALAGVRSNRDAVGARVLLTAGGRTQVRELAAGIGFCGGFEARLFFGLGTATRVERIEVRWPSGTVQTVADAAAGATIRIVEAD